MYLGVIYLSKWISKYLFEFNTNINNNNNNNK